MEEMGQPSSPTAAPDPDQEPPPPLLSPKKPWSVTRMPSTPARTEVCSADSSMHSFAAADLFDRGLGGLQSSRGISLPLHLDDASSSCSRRRKRRQQQQGAAVFAALPDYFHKWTGQEGLRGRPLSPLPSMRHNLLSMLQATVSITTLASMNQFFAHEDIVLVIASFGATAVLIYSAFDSPLAQPRNVLYGHTISAIVGVSVQKLLCPWQPALAAGLAVGLAIAIMEWTCTVHPPGGATALFAVIGPKRIHDLGFFFVLCPCLLGTVVMLFIALVFNNLDEERSYPQAWDFPEVVTCVSALGKGWRACALLLPQGRAQQARAALYSIP